MPILGVLVVIGIVWYFVRYADPGSEADAGTDEEELIRLCLGNRKQAERLIALELERARGIVRAEAARRALRSFRRDIK